jgi:hypothetical protein
MIWGIKHLNFFLHHLKFASVQRTGFVMPEQGIVYNMTIAVHKYMA